ncbi:MULTISPECIES: hypothetical protein [Mesorhizobium]|uniref:hypothetical protein n=1 Tax=Mesorhizobium TaxID=68287 RepID=UPI0012E9A8EC|nr:MULTISPECIES: hypothetical protein [Mesorhizobium]QIA25206.1 hypothetical protein A9K68_028000 [Mesorhizobium sp. AA22]
MKTNMQAYGVTELTREEACATSGGWFWLASAVFSGVAALVFGIAAVITYVKHH